MKKYIITSLILFFTVISVKAQSTCSPCNCPGILPIYGQNLTGCDLYLQWEYNPSCSVNPGINLNSSKKPLPVFCMNCSDGCQCPSGCGYTQHGYTGFFTLPMFSGLSTPPTFFALHIVTLPSGVQVHVSYSPYNGGVLATFTNIPGVPGC